jgi:histidinol-phosphate/aromatic aminotransferase/cobyric acid decarboxylase-like protein
MLVIRYVLSSFQIARMEEEKEEMNQEVAMMKEEKEEMNQELKNVKHKLELERRRTRYSSLSEENESTHSCWVQRYCLNN